MLLPQEITFDHMVEEFDKRPVEVEGVQDDNWSPEEPELFEGYRLGQFFKCADASGECHYCIRTGEHIPFALTHIGGDDHFSYSVMTPAFIIHKRRYYAGYFSAVPDNRVGKGTHQPDASPSVNHA